MDLMIISCYTFFFKLEDIDSVQTGLYVECTHAEMQSQFHAHKDICKEISYYDLL